MPSIVAVFDGAMEKERNGTEAREGRKEAV
jgi:hypothetical protein